MKKHRYRLIEAPSILGLKPKGVELLPYALRVNGFLREIEEAPLVVGIEVNEYSNSRSSNEAVLNDSAIARYSLRLANAIKGVIDGQQFPVVLGGDCSILLGCMLALKQRGRYGLCHIDAHADFYQPSAEPTGEAASMDLALVTGRGPELLTNLNGEKPYVLDEDVVQIGQRDAQEADQAGSLRPQDTAIICLDLNTLRQEGISWITAQALNSLSQQPTKGFWIHFDADVLADEIMPAVDYRLPGGLSFGEASLLLKNLCQSPKAVGLSITIFNPKLDKDGQLTKHLVKCLHEGLE